VGVLKHHPAITVQHSSATAVESHATVHLLKTARIIAMQIAAIAFKQHRVLTTMQCSEIAPDYHLAIVLPESSHHRNDPTNRHSF
jgi:hypothetical protein